MAKTETFKSKAKVDQIKWRKVNIFSNQHGTYGIDKKTGKPIPYEHIVPLKKWKETLWQGIQESLPAYIENHIKPHTGVNNLLSSWVLNANLYFPIKTNNALKKVMLEFLKLKVSVEITELNDIELEYAFEKDNPLHPENLLGEKGGSRGTGQTSPDIAFLVKTKKGEGIILTECKFTEHSFYGCSARRIEHKGEREGNPDPSRCLKHASGYDYKSNCHQNVWERKYWSLLNLSDFGKQYLKRCPAATSGYQLFRQQALAEGIMNSSKYSLVASTVAFDNRNSVLINSLKLTGLSDFQTDWEKIFESKTIFKTWHHHEWVQFVSNNNDSGLFDDWLNYIQNRYDY